MSVVSGARGTGRQCAPRGTRAGMDRALNRTVQRAPLFLLTCRSGQARHGRGVTNDNEVPGQRPTSWAVSRLQGHGREDAARREGNPIARLANKACG